MCPDFSSPASVVLYLRSLGDRSKAATPARLVCSGDLLLIGRLRSRVFEYGDITEKRD